MRPMSGRLRIGACLSLSGKFAQFGRQAAQGLETWRSLDGAAEILIEDDQSDRRTLEAVLPGVAARSDILLGPYSTQLMRAAGRMAAESGWLVWNHGGSGDDVEGAHPGHVVSVLTPTSRYAEPFLLRLASEPRERRDLCIVHGPGSFGRQAADGAQTIARGWVSVYCVPLLTTRSRHQESRQNGTSSARASSSKTPSWSARPFARPPLRVWCVPSQQACASSAASSTILTVSSALPSGSRAAGMMSRSGLLKMYSLVPTPTARARCLTTPRCRPPRER